MNAVYERRREQDVPEARTVADRAPLERAPHMLETCIPGGSLLWATFAPAT